MRAIRIVIAGCVAAGILRAQPAPPNLTPERQPDYQAMMAAVRTLRRSAAADVGAQVDPLLAEAGSGARSEGRRKLAHAWVLLKGGTWDAKQEYQWSLALRPDVVVADSTLPSLIRMTQIYPASYKGAEPSKVRVSLRHADDSEARAIGTFDMPASDLIEQPFTIPANLDGMADGIYHVRAEVLDGDAVLATVVSPLVVVKGITRDHAALEHRLTAIQGHEGAKASIRYPYVLAETVNMGRRRFDGSDFGLPFQPQTPFDFANGVAMSAALLKSLESGKDPLYRAKGDHERHYWFEEAGEMMAYHLYVPSKWDGRSKLPMVLVLHGNTRDQDYYFDRDEHILAKLAEQHGYLVVCPMGYRPSAGWGSNSLNAQGRGGVTADPARRRQGELSEKDALNVLDLVTKEYPIDADRVFLFGHSAGGAGTWYLGEKYAGKWAAIAASAAATRPAGFPFDRLKGMPIMVCHGDQDDEVPVASSRNMVKAAKDAGLDPQYLEVPGATHLTIVALVEPKVFDFFDQHPRKH
ncbi:MAG TPA: prolyl oligopeptidase family serine peptidase [Bryobacteraceae bacterium]|nr:prolyl oligopeptidase family serine peptidase [Bryobacteraceae bacterium]